MSVRQAVALNGRFSGAQKPTGTQTVAFNLFDAIIRTERNIPVVVAADPAFPGVEKWSSYPLTTFMAVPFRSWSRAKAQLWEQFTFPEVCRKTGCRLAHHPMNTCPRFQAGISTIVTVHDLNFLLHPEWYGRSFRLVYRFFAIPGIKKAHRVVTISDYVSREVAEHLGIPASRLRRIYNGVKALPETSRPEADVPAYLLCVGSLQPHKNLPRLIRAFQKVRHERPALQLWIIGKPQAGFQSQPELQALLQSEGVRSLGYVSDEELSRYYQQAAAFCFPSLEEGFGLPVLEAMMARVPVVTSNISCLPEIAGPAAELVDPWSEEALAGGIRRVLGLGAAERARRIAAAREWALRFTWEKAAQAYLSLYEEMLA